MRQGRPVRVEIVDQREVLEHEAERADAVRPHGVVGEAHEIRALDLDLTRARSQHAGEQIEQGRLAATRRSVERHARAALHPPVVEREMERFAARSVRRGVGEAETGDLDRRLSRQGGSPPVARS